MLGLASFILPIGNDNVIKITQLLVSKASKVRLQLCLTAVYYKNESPSLTKN